MDWSVVRHVLILIQHAISFMGVLIIATGVFLAVYQYGSFILAGKVFTQGAKINTIRLNLARILILGLEFIVAADLIGSTTAPDYYAVGLLAIIVIIRTLLTFSINRELMMIKKE